MQLKPDTQVAIGQATPLFAESTYTLQPRKTLAIASRMPHLLDHDATGIVTPSAQFKHHDFIFISFLLAAFKIFTPEQINQIQPVDRAMLSFIIQHEDTTEIYINELLKVPSKNPEQEPFWFRTPEDPENPTTYTPIQQRNYTELLELKQLEKLNPQDSQASKESFFFKF